jgi:hypothetical protein
MSANTTPTKATAPALAPAPPAADRDDNDKAGDSKEVLPVDGGATTDGDGNLVNGAPQQPQQRQLSEPGPHIGNTTGPTAPPAQSGIDLTGTCAAVSPHSDVPKQKGFACMIPQTESEEDSFFLAVRPSSQGGSLPQELFPLRGGVVACDSHAFDRAARVLRMPGSRGFMTRCDSTEPSVLGELGRLASTNKFWMSVFNLFCHYDVGCAALKQRCLALKKEHCITNTLISVTLTHEDDTSATASPAKRKSPTPDGTSADVPTEVVVSSTDYRRDESHKSIASPPRSTSLRRSSSKRKRSPLDHDSRKLLRTPPICAEVRRLGGPSNHVSGNAKSASNRKKRARTRNYARSRSHSYYRTGSRRRRQDDHATKHSRHQTDFRSTHKRR